MGFFNTKDWQTRINEIKQTLRANTNRLTALGQIDIMLTTLNVQQQKQLSESLHLNLPGAQADKAKRDLIRAVTFLEMLVFGAPTAAPVLAEYAGLPALLLGARVDTLLFAMEPGPGAFLGKVRPLRPGLSISGGGHPGPGSIGCFVTCNQTGRAMLLSNEHVMRAEFGNAQPAAQPVILQPSKGNGGVSLDKVAVYDRGRLDPSMDAAVAYLENGVGFSNTLPNGITLRAPTGVLPKVGDIVFKWGPSSGRTVGVIKKVGFATSVPHARFGGNINFTGQMEVEPLLRRNAAFQIPGDSGSILFDVNGHVVGLMHGGGGGGVATPIAAVLTGLNIAI